MNDAATRAMKVDWHSAQVLQQLLEGKFLK